MTTYEALISKPVMMTSVRFPRLHAVVYQEVFILVTLEDNQPVPPEVKATAFLDDMTYVGLIDSSKVVIGIPATTTA